MAVNPKYMMTLTELQAITPAPDASADDIEFIKTDSFYATQVAVLLQKHLDSKIDEATFRSQLTALIETFEIENMAKSAARNILEELG